MTRQVTRNLNQIIDVNFYPVETARRSNMRHRPIGMGVQVGLAVILPLYRSFRQWSSSTRPHQSLLDMYSCLSAQHSFSSRSNSHGLISS